MSAEMDTEFNGLRISQNLLHESLTYCELVRTGIKPIACITCQNRYADAVISLVESETLLSYVEQNGPDWKVVYMFKDNIMIEIIKELPDKPKSPFEHWVCGKAFGYSDSSIVDFIKKC
jgi:hypothetical protein